MIKKILFFISIFYFFFDTFSQSYLTKYENFLESTLINPAITGADFIPKVTISYNKQFMNVNQSPCNFFLSGQMRLGKFDYYDPSMFLNKTKFKSLERVGLGAGLYSDINGPFREFNLLLTYSYHIPVSDLASFSFGITGKLNHYGVNSSKINPRENDDPFVYFESSTNANANTGLYYYHQKYFAGVSLLNLFKPLRKEINNVESQPILYIIGGYRYQNENKSFIIEPILTYSYDLENKINRFDYHIKFYLLQYGWVSFSYKNAKQIGIILALKVHKSLYFAYKFDNGPKEVGLFGYGTHGIVIGKNLGVNRNIKSE